MKIHKEGYRTLFLSLVLLIAINIPFRYYFPNEKILLYSLAGLSIAFFLIVLQFFRHPKRRIEKNPINIIAPADGKVVVIEETEETEYFKDKRLQISIFMSPVNVHVNRYPIAGMVKYAKYHPGLYLVAWHPKSSTDNERTTVVVGNDRLELLFRQVAGALARRIVMYSKVGDVVEQGQEMGFIKFGSRVDLYFPLGTKVNVALNQKVKGGKTIIATLD